MLAILRDTWALLLGFFVLMLGSGLLGSLLGVRAGIESWPPAVTGVVMAGYYLGFLAAASVVPRLLARVGHIRVFVALGALASVVALGHAVLVTPWTWLPLRLLTGLALCGVYITTESWLNGRTGNATRGRLLAFYMVVQLGGGATGSLLLSVGALEGMGLFVLAAALLSAATLPLLLVPGPAPRLGTPRRVAFADVYRNSPLALVAVFGIGVAQGGLYGGITAVYAREIGLSVAGIGAFVAATLAGGVLFQGPAGWLADRFDRRLVVTVTTFLAAGCAAAAALLDPDPAWRIGALFFLLAGASLPMYSLCVALANDRLDPARMVGTSGALLLANGVGSVLGPIGSAGAMQLVGPAGFPAFVAAVHAAIGVHAVLRTVRRSPSPLAAAPGSGALQVEKVEVTATIGK